MSKNARDRAAAAKRIVAQQKAAERRRVVMIWTSVAVVVVLAIAGVAGWAVYSSQHKKSTGNAASATPSVAVDSGTAFSLGSGPVTVDLYEDFMCPICHEFEGEAGATVQQLATSGKITARYHPVAILDDRSNGTKYSTRAAGAAAAAAVDGKFIQYHDALYANQPQENSSGLTDAKLIELGKNLGLGDTFAQAVTARTYDGWATTVTDTFSSRGYTGTPTVVVGGKVLDGSNGGIPTAADLTAAVAKAAG